MPNFGKPLVRGADPEPRAANSAAQRRSSESRRRADIVAAVERLLLRGEKFANLNVAHIANEAGTSRSTFYLLFADKKAVIEHLIERLEDELLDAVNLTGDFVGPVTLDMLRMAMVRLIRVYRSRVAFFSAIAETAASDAAISTHYRAMIEDTVFVRRAHFRAQQARGMAREQLPDATHRCLAWMVERTVSQYITAATDSRVTEDADAMALADALADIVWRVLYRDVAPATPDPARAKAPTRPRRSSKR